MRKPVEMRRREYKARAELRRYQAHLAKMAYQPEPVYHDQFACRHAVDPDGVVSVLYYSTGVAVPPTCSMWRVP